jgi:RNA polymerase sigma factor (TIGR02999 family)
MNSSENISFLLAAWSDGDESALEKLMPLVGHELRRMARAQMKREAVNHTLQTTALINEAFLRLVEQKHVHWQNRSHFYAISALIMRRTLINHAKNRLRLKRGNGAVHYELNEAISLTDEKSLELIALDEALNHLAEIDPLKSQIVEMRHFGGMSVEETADVLKISPVTVIRHWNMAKSWLKREMKR